MIRQNIRKVARYAKKKLQSISPVRGCSKTMTKEEISRTFVLPKQKTFFTPDSFTDLNSLIEEQMKFLCDLHNKVTVGRIKSKNSESFKKELVSALADRIPMSSIEAAAVQCMKNKESVVFIDTNCNTASTTIDFRSLAIENHYRYDEIDTQIKTCIMEDISGNEIVAMSNMPTFLYIKLPMQRSEDYDSKHPTSAAKWTENNIKMIRNRLIYELEHSGRNDGRDFECPVNIITDNFCILNWALDDHAGQYAGVSNSRRRKNVRCISCF